MKANQAFRNNDEAVSPVIAVILMVAITVVLAATVYVWVSGFGANGNQAKNLSLSEVSCAPGVDGTSATVAKFSVTSVSPNFGYSTLNATDTSSGAHATTTSADVTANSLFLLASSGSLTGNIAAGDVVTLTTSAAAGGANDITCAGGQISFIDTSSSTVVATLTMHS